MARPRRSEQQVQMLKVLGENVRKARESAGMSQEQLAKAVRGDEPVGPDADYIRDIEKGRVEPSILRFLHIAWALDVDPAKLAEGLSSS